METAKVDIRRLQLLNDRINQCLDALNQVRLSVHGLSHSGIAPEATGAGYPLTGDPRLGDPRFAAGMFAAPIQNPAWGQGLAHSAPGYGTAGFGAAPAYGAYGAIPTGFWPGMTPQVQSPLGFAQGQIPLANPFGGLSHTGADLEGFNRPSWADPFLAVKVAQTFPYARFVVPPVVALY